jgi:hypothetical protein
VKLQLARVQAGALRPAQLSVVRPLAMFGARQLAQPQALQPAHYSARQSRKIKLRVTVRRRPEAFRWRVGPEHRVFTTALTPAAFMIFAEFRLAD